MPATANRQKLLAAAVFTAMCFNGLLARPAGAENLIVNGGFETRNEATDFATGWGRHWSYTGDSKVITEASTAHGGNACISIAQAGPNASTVFTTVGSARITPQGNRKYRLSVWAKGNGQLSAMAYLYGGGSFLEPDNNAVTPTAWNEIHSEAWQQYFFDVVIPETAVLAASKQTTKIDQFEVLFNVKSGPILLDDVALEPAVPAGPVTIGTGPTPLTTFTVMPAPTIDGVVDPAEWSRASGTTGFFAQGGSAQATRQTKVYAGFDEKNLYIAFQSKEDALAIKEAPPTQHTLPGNDLEAFEIWLKPPGKGYFQYIAVPGGASYAASKDASNNGWGSHIQYASKVLDSGEMHGGILSLGKKLWSGEIIIPFSEMGITAPVDGAQWRVNFCRDFSVGEGVARAQQDWTTWAPLTGNFSDTDSFGYAQFSRKATPYKTLAIGDLSSGQVAVGCENQGGVSIHNTVVSQQIPDKPVVERSLTRTERGEFELKDEVKTSVTGVTPMQMQLSVKDADGELLAQSSIPFKLQPAFSIEPHLLYGRGQIEVAISASRLSQLPKSAHAELWLAQAEGDETQSKTIIPIDPANPTFTAAVDISHAAAGAYLVKAVVKDDGGATLASTAEPITIPEKPVWWDNTLGIVDTVPTPFTPIAVHADSAEVVLRKYALQGNGLPAQITSAGEQMLNAPISINAVVNGQPVKWTFKPLELLEQKPRQAKWRISGTSDVLDLSGTLTLSFDGFGLWDVSFKPKTQITIQQLSIDVPVKKEHALFAKGDGSVVASIIQDRFTSAPDRDDVVLLGNKVTEWGSWSYSRKGWIWPTRFFNEVYVGSDQRGFSLMTETNRNVYGAKYAEFTADNAAASEMMRINLISEATSVVGSLPYKYFFQTTPVKPEPKDAKRWHLTFDPGSVYNAELPGYQNEKMTGLLKRAFVGQAYYDLVPDGYPKFARGASESHSGLDYFHGLGVKIVHNLWYSAIADSLPEYKMFGREWAALPTYGWPTPNSTLTSACENSAYQQFMIWCTNQTINTLGFDGVYTDATAVPCDNAYHGCGYIGRDGKRHTDLNMLATRSFVERLYNILKEDGKDRINFSHSGESTSSASFVDVRTHGEELCWEDKDHYRRLSPDYFRAKYAENEYGVPYTFYPVFHYTWRAIGKPVPTSEVMMMCLVHRTMPAIAFDPEVGPIWDLFDPWWTSSKFIPYWKPDAPATTSDPINLLASTYLKAESHQALIVVSNWSYSDQTTTVHLDASKLGFEPTSVSLVDSSNNATTPVSLNDVPLKLSSRDYRVLLVK